MVSRRQTHQSHIIGTQVRRSEGTNTLSTKKNRPKQRHDQISDQGNQTTKDGIVRPLNRLLQVFLDRIFAKNCGQTIFTEPILIACLFSMHNGDSASFTSPTVEDRQDVTDDYPRPLALVDASPNWQTLDATHPLIRDRSSLAEFRLACR